MITVEASLATALTVLGAWIGCTIISKPTELYGRRPVLLFNCTLFIAGGILSASTHSVFTLLIGRFISGLGMGIGSGVPVVLLSEIATNTTRGAVTSVHQIMITIGIFSVGLLSYGFVMYVEHGWQYIQGFPAIPAGIVLFLSQYVPESPKWVLAKGYSSHIPSPPSRKINPEQWNVEDDVKVHMERARQIMTSLRHIDHNIDQELLAMVETAKQDAKLANVTWEEVFSYREGLFVGGGLMVFQALTGINSITFYSTTIFALAGFDQSVIGTVLVGVVRLGMAVIVVRWIDRTGRKVLLLYGTYLM